MASKDRNDEPDAAGRLKRLALQVAVQLPEDTGDALEVLDLARSIVTGFLMDKPATKSRPPAPGPLTLIR